MSTTETKRDFFQKASFRTTVITATLLFTISIFFSRVAVNVLVFILLVVFFHLIVYIVTRHVYDTVRRGFELLVQKENCVVEEIKEVELRSRRGKFIYNRTYNSISLNQVSQLYFRQDKLP